MMLGHWVETDCWAPRQVDQHKARASSYSWQCVEISSLRKSNRSHLLSAQVDLTSP
jgi:hypothetical protein